jgi:hypothetical protein
LHANRVIFIGLSVIIILSGGFVIWPNYAAGNAIAAIDFPSSTSLYNLDGERISVVEVGVQSIIGMSAHNNNPAEQSFVIIVEVRDGTGVTEYLAWQSGKVAPNGDYTMEISWMPHAECSIPNEACNNYGIRSFAITSLVNPQVLSPVSETDGIRVTGSPPISLAPKQYDLLLNNQTFPIEYSFSGGKITQIEVSGETESMVFSLMTPSDSRLSISIPQELAEYVFPNSIATGDALVAFVDEVPVDMNQTVDSRTGSFTFVMAIEAGSEQLEFVGSWLI